MRLFVRDKEFYKSFLKLTGVMALQNLITFTVNLADNIMIGAYSQDALSGVSLVNQIQFLLQMLVLGVGNGIAVLGAQYWGKKQVGPIRKVVSVGMLFALVIGISMMLLTFFLPEKVLSLLTNEQDVVKEGAKYLVIVCFTYLFFAITNVLLASLRSVETVKIGFIVTLAALVVNIFLNYGLIYGRLGMPELGVEGAAIATLAARILEFVIVLGYVLFFDRKIRWQPKQMFCIDKIMFQDYCKVGIPLIFTDGIWGIAMSVQTAILGRLGSDTIAGNSIAVTIFQVVTVLTYAAANSSSVIIGKTVGEGDIPRVKQYAKTLQMLYLMIGVLTSGILLLCKNSIISLYDVTPNAKVLANQFICVLAFTVIGTSYQCPCLTGIVTGGGDTKFVLINDFIHQWFVVIPSAFLCAFVFKTPLWVVFLCLKSDQILKCFVAIFKVNRFRWIRQLTR